MCIIPGVQNPSTIDRLITEFLGIAIPDYVHSCSLSEVTWVVFFQVTTPF